MAVPSIAACFLSTPYWEVSFVTGYNFNPFISFGELFGMVFDDYWKYVWPVVLISTLQITASSLIMSAIDRHFRTGKMSLRSPFRLMNMSIVPILLSVLIMCAVGIVWRFVLYGLVSLAQTIAAAASFNSTATIVIITLIALVLFYLHVMIIVPMLYWAPLMFVYGYGLRDAASYSFKMIGGKKLFAGLIIPMFLCAGIQLLTGFLGAHVAVATAVNFAVYLFTNMYVTVYVIVSFYNISELDRRDVVIYTPILQEPVKPAEKTDKTKTKEKAKPAQKTDAESSDADGNDGETAPPSSEKTENETAGTSEKAKNGSAKKKNKKIDVKNEQKRADAGAVTPTDNIEHTEAKGDGDVV